jgi:hypothetical protein
MRLIASRAAVVATMAVTPHALAQAQPPYPQPAQPYAAQPAPTPGPTAGGLESPPPIDPEATEPQPTDTEKNLKEGDEEDSGRGLSWFYLDAEGGFEHLGLETFAVDESNIAAGFIDTKASGGFVGAGLGVQLLFITIGPRFRAGFFENFKTLGIGGELGFRFPILILEPHFELGGGYMTLTGLTLGEVGDTVDIRGGYGRVSGGLDVFIGSYFSIGGGIGWEFFGLTRPGVAFEDLSAEQQQSVDEAQRTALAAEGSSYGSAITIFGKLGLHL